LGVRKVNYCAEACKALNERRKERGERREEKEAGDFLCPEMGKRAGGITITDYPDRS